MEEAHLYRKIAETIRQEILAGKLQPGDRLPSVRDMAERWNCTLGTVQHAYRDLAAQGLVTSRTGQGTRVVENLPSSSDEAPLRRAALIHRAEAFLLEVLTAGYTVEQAEEAVREAMDRWRVVSQEASPSPAQTLRFAGSHDLAITWLASHFSEVAPGFTLQVSFGGSLNGLIALAEGRADIAGSHLWDQDTDIYNIPFVERILPGQRVALITLAHRRIGLIVPPGNPAGLHALSDLTQEDLRFVNRQPGSGTRVWLDSQVQHLGLDPSRIPGYSITKMTHHEVAHAIGQGQANAGIGLEGAAHAYGLEFIPLTTERYDLVIPADKMELPPVLSLAGWLASGQAKAVIGALGGYDTRSTGQIEWIE